MKTALEKYIYVKKICKIVVAFALCFFIFSYAKKEYTNPDFGKTFGTKATKATLKLQNLKENFIVCSSLCNQTPLFMQAIVFPEVMRYNSIKDGIEAESLRTLYVQFGEEYANFSIGIFQMKPTFAVQVETKAKQLLPDTMYKEFELDYDTYDEETIREQRVDRLQDDDWQMVYLTAFICICNKICATKNFINDTEKLQWYATVYNAGFDKTDAYIKRKITEANFYINQKMPDKKFVYAAIADYYFTHKQTK
jgi:hypothetical protein